MRMQVVVNETACKIVLAGFQKARDIVDSRGKDSDNVRRADALREVCSTDADF